MTRLGFLIANLGRKPVRTWLTFLSIVVCFLLFGLLRSVGTAFTSPPSLSGIDRLVVSPKYSMIDPLPVSHMNQVRSVPGVEAAAHADWFGGTYTYQGRELGLAFPKIPVKPLEYFDLYPEFRISPEQLETFENTRTGAVARRSTAERFGWRIGDVIPIVADIYPKMDGSLLWEFELVGIYDVSDEASAYPDDFYIHHDFFEEAKQHSKGMMGWVMVRVENPDVAAEVASAIDARFENSRDPTRTMTEKEWNAQFAKQIGNIGLMVTMILAAVFFSILLLVGNTMFQAFRERLRDLGVLKALGFNDGQVARMLLYESLILTLGGGVVGLFLSYALLRLVSPVLQTFGTFSLDTLSVFLGLATAIGLGLVVGTVPAIRARSAPIVEVLRARA